MPLTVQGHALKFQVAKEAGVAVNQLKLICAGRVIKDDITLGEQNVQVGCDSCLHLPLIIIYHFLLM